MKRALIITAAALVLVGIGVGVYFFFFASRPTLTAVDGTFLPGSDSVMGDEDGSVPAQELGVPAPGAGTEFAPRFIRISEVPVVSGASAVYLRGTIATSTAQSGSTTAYAVDPDVSISFIEKESGNVFEFRAHERTLTRVSNKTLPGIEDAVWTPDGSTAFVRFLERSGGSESISTYALPRSGEGGYTLERNISQVLMVGSSTLMTYKSNPNSSTATLSTLLGTNPRTLFSSPISRLAVSTGGGLVVATTKASSQLDGYTFTVNQKDGTLTRTLGPLRGLTTLVSHSGAYILYTYLDGKKLILAVYDVKNNSAIRLPFSTLVEKCVWSYDSAYIYCGVPTTISGTFPDDWYQGATQTSDRIWRITLSSRVATQVVSPEVVGAGQIDSHAFASDRMGDVLVFRNRLDGTLWMYDL